ncbi:hypothetical protein BAUCODRAFT_287753 [Baudoinia panamericana UAMH 10762]|uniref:Uncharacterized protein n=1 Tax=Baudoinia panamericana (strain UAMH 10762) TaxID=717646 RepID=M2MM10_BAUPA|nr:uncharacterized protein BAUCODRAFT_287753 [Baudoinia panamericana UAMH 10762]EMC92413.1 hypothetical protein BAUCODRAFT_287753 [Baudoinia panamericana UAMH 10762]
MRSPSVHDCCPSARNYSCFSMRSGQVLALWQQLHLTTEHRTDTLLWMAYGGGDLYLARFLYWQFSESRASNGHAGLSNLPSSLHIYSYGGETSSQTPRDRFSNSLIRRRFTVHHNSEKRNRPLFYGQTPSACYLYRA